MLYQPITNAAYFVAVILLLLHVKEYKSFCTFPVLVDQRLFHKSSEAKSRLTILAFLESVLVFALTVVMIFPLNAPLSKLFLGDTSDGYFPIIYFVPFGLFILGVIMRLTPLKLLDFAAPADCLLLIIVKIACYCEGCCYGIELASSPFFNHKNERYEFPIQLIEIACAVAMFIVLSIMRKKRKRAGFMFPAFIVMYCASRFVFEFWRDDYPDVVGGMNGNQIMSLIGLVFGIILCVGAAIWGERITTFFDQRNRAFLVERQKQMHLKRIKKG